MSTFNYIPFLKLKRNEAYALHELEKALKTNLTVFFDMPNELPFKSRADKSKPLISQKTEIFKKNIQNQIKYFEKQLDWLQEFYFDNYDVDSFIFVENKFNYQVIIDSFAKYGMIPVCGIDDRVPAHLESIINSAKAGSFITNEIAIRLVQTTYEDYDYIKDNLQNLTNTLKSHFEQITLIFDARYIDDLNSDIISINEFIQKMDNNIFSKIIITGSTIPASASELIGTNDHKDFYRREIMLFKNIINNQLQDSNLILGDYACISPDTTFLDIYAEEIQNYMTGKVYYIYQDKMFVARSSKLKGKYAPFKPLLDQTIAHPFFRGATYSEGDKYMAEKQVTGLGVTPSTIVKPNINAHVTFMLKGFTL